MNDKFQSLWSSYKRSQAEQAVLLQQINDYPSENQIVALLAYAEAAQQALVKLSQETGK